MENVKRNNKKKILILVILALALLLVFLLSLFLGVSNMSFIDVINTIFGNGTNASNRILFNIRIPRALAGLLVGAALSIGGLILQTTLNNDMASPQTLGVTNACVFGANLSILVFSGGMITTGNNLENYSSQINSIQTSIFAVTFGILCLGLILSLSYFKRYNANTIILIGIALGALFQALTTILQYYSTDISLSAAIFWSFGDLQRATYPKLLAIFIVLVLSLIFFILNSWHYNALLSGEDSASSLGVRTKRIRIISLLLVSILTALSVAFFGIIAFVGIICPHIMKRIIGYNHKYLIPASMLCGSILLIVSDIIARTIAGAISLPVGAVTSIIGAPFFLYIIFRKKV